MRVSRLAFIGASAMFAVDCAFGAGNGTLPSFPEFGRPRAITQGPKDHFFASYYAINSWSPDNRYALVLETDIKEGLPDGRPCTACGNWQSGQAQKFGNMWHRPLCGMRN